MKKIAALLLVLCLLLSALAGCGGKSPAEDEGTPAPVDDTTPAPDTAPDNAPPEEEDNSSGEEAPEESAYMFPLEETVTLSYLNMFNPGLLSIMDGQQDVSAEQEYERMTNVHMEYVNASPDTFAELFTVALLSEDLTDIIDNGIAYYAGGGAGAVEDGYFVNLNDYLDFMPVYKADLENKDILRRVAYAADGVIAGVYSVMDANNVNGVIIRQDWLDELDMDVPVTYDDVEEVLKAMKTELGVEHPLELPSFLDYQYNMFSGNFGAPGSFDMIGMSQQLFVVDGEVRYAQYTTEYEEYVKMIARFYEEGLLDPDFVGYEMVRDYQEKINNGEVGLYLNSTTNLEDTMAVMEGTGASLAGIASPMKEAGQVNHLTTYKEEVSPFGAVSIACSCENIEVACQWLDYKFTDEIQHLFDFGVEGETYNYDDSGNVVWTDLIMNNPDGLNVTQAMAKYTGSDMGSSERQATMYTDRQKQAVAAWTSNVDGDWCFPSGIELSAEVSGEASALLGDIRTYISENVLKFVVGNRSLNEFEAFREELKGIGIERVLEIYQEAYDGYMAK